MIVGPKSFLFANFGQWVALSSQRLFFIPSLFTKPAIENPLLLNPSHISTLIFRRYLVPFKKLVYVHGTIYMSVLLFFLLKVSFVTNLIMVVITPSYSHVLGLNRTGRGAWILGVILEFCLSRQNKAFILRHASYKRIFYFCSGHDSSTISMYNSNRGYTLTKSYNIKIYSLF